MIDRYAQTGRTTRMLLCLADYAITHEGNSCVVICLNGNHADMIADMFGTMFPSIKKAQRTIFRFPNDTTVIFISNHTAKEVKVGKFYDFVVEDHAVR